MQIANYQVSGKVPILGSLIVPESRIQPPVAHPSPGYTGGPARSIVIPGTLVPWLPPLR
jgi:hypothetical protein